MVALSTKNKAHFSAKRAIVVNRRKYTLSDPFERSLLLMVGLTLGEVPFCFFYVQKKLNHFGVSKFTSWLMLKVVNCNRTLGSLAVDKVTSTGTRLTVLALATQETPVGDIAWVEQNRLFVGKRTGRVKPLALVK